MGFSLYWEWEKSIADAEKFATWSREIQFLLTYLTTPEHSIPAFFSFDRYYVVEENADGSRFLSEIDPPPREENWLIICGPEGTSEPIFTPTRVAFNGSEMLREAGESFSLSLEDLEQAPFWKACKTGDAPYASLVICALARFLYHFPEAIISNDEGEKPIAKAVTFCQHIFAVS